MRASTTTFNLLAAAISGVAAQGSGQQIGNFTTGTLGNASAITDNPAGAAYIATLPDEAFNKTAYPNGGNVKGSVQAVSMPNGDGVMFHVSFSNLPSEGGPFLYHLHDQPVPEDGNCTRTLGHLDPYERGETVPCDSTIPTTCQVGDLSGKHGKVELNGSDTYTATYVDNFASTVEGIGAFFGNRSFVFHFANTTRITCANFSAVQASSNACSTSSSGSAAITSTSSRTSTSTGTRTTGRPTTTGRPGNSTTTSAPAVVVTAAAYVNSAKAGVAVAAAGLAFLL